ncbi:uncharacterized protein LOC133805348 [Humulus lupulus]|uniref:uncharacterized protein LOC133805348 n=1 Tax=Humulus lupulus TaxID=3486 RepID=UPI002B405C58|nr:uncharacterized protein LOC133805348 [Humulus lupulus]XP_062099492.1 uncharacterized protein LOC133805348 [Humulus lupulus]
MENPDTETTRSLPPEQEPDSKKPKMSTATTSDDEHTTTATTDDTKKPRYKRRKVAIFFAYCGVGYQGMQKNPGAKTIEGDLEEGLYHAGAVPEHDRNNPKRYDWARSARTDKGVSAVGQVVSGRFYVDPPGFVDRLNANLSPQIRIFGYKRVTGSFNAKKFCDRRRYVYLIPLFALDPNSHPNRESVMASLGSGNELFKCHECSERGRKVVGLMGKRNYELRGSSFELDISSNTESAKVDSALGEDIDISSINGNASDPNSKSIKEIQSENGDAGSNKVQNEVLDSNEGNAAKDTTGDVEEISGEDNPVKKSNFSYGENEKERFNRILNYYVGTHNFHNFTTRTKAEDPAAWRFIISFNANTIVTVEGMEFIKCEVVGQSFMLHQIRKLIGLAVAVMRNCAPESLIEKALQKDVNMNVPTAPEVGLYLDECFFTSYNEKWKDSHEELSMKEYEQEASDFKMKHIYSHIALTEQKEGVVALWLHSLNHRNYPDLQVVNDENETNKISSEAEKSTAE